MKHRELRFGTCMDSRKTSPMSPSGHNSPSAGTIRHFRTWV